MFTPTPTLALPQETILGENVQSGQENWQPLQPHVAKLAKEGAKLTSQETRQVTTRLTPEVV
jgi:hypothetical protein